MIAAQKRASASVAKPSRTHATHVAKTMTVSEITTLYPQTRDVLAEYGLHCFGCAFNALETLDEGCQGHGFSDTDIDNLVEDLNALIDQSPQRPPTLAITEAAAKAIDAIARKEGKAGQGLVVIADDHGGFCLEFKPNAASGERTFCHANVPQVRIFASTLSLSRIGGSVIDFRDGRFKLDLEPVSEGCACGGKCRCQ